MQNNTSQNIEISENINPFELGVGDLIETIRESNSLKLKPSLEKIANKGSSISEEVKNLNNSTQQSLLSQGQILKEIVSLTKNLKEFAEGITRSISSFGNFSAGTQSQSTTPSPIQSGLDNILSSFGMGGVISGLSTGTALMAPLVPNLIQKSFPVNSFFGGNSGGNSRSSNFRGNSGLGSLGNFVSGVRSLGSSLLPNLGGGAATGSSLFSNLGRGAATGSSTAQTLSTPSTPSTTISNPQTRPAVDPIKAAINQQIKDENDPISNFSMSKQPDILETFSNDYTSPLPFAKKDNFLSEYLDTNLTNQRVDAVKKSIESSTGIENSTPAAPTQASSATQTQQEQEPSTPDKLANYFEAADPKNISTFESIVNRFIKDGKGPFVGNLSEAEIKALEEMKNAGLFSSDLDPQERAERLRSVLQDPYIREGALSISKDLSGAWIKPVKELGETIFEEINVMNQPPQPQQTPHQTNTPQRQQTPQQTTPDNGGPLGPAVSNFSKLYPAPPGTESPDILNDIFDRTLYSGPRISNTTKSTTGEIPITPSRAQVNGVGSSATENSSSSPLSIPKLPTLSETTLPLSSEQLNTMTTPVQPAGGSAEAIEVNSPTKDTPLSLNAEMANQPPVTDSSELVDPTAGQKVAANDAAKNMELIRQQSSEDSRNTGPDNGPSDSISGKGRPPSFTQTARNIEPSPTHRGSVSTKVG